MQATIPPGVEYNATLSLDAMIRRGLTYPEKLTSTCKQVASVMLKKADIADRKAVRMLTNRLVAHAYTESGL